MPDWRGGPCRGMPGRVRHQRLGVRAVRVPITLTSTPRPCRWVAVMTLALGLVAMHHLVDTHTHPSGSQHSSPGMTMLAPAIENYGSTSRGAAVVPAQPGIDGGLMLHLCQAVLRPANSPAPAPSSPPTAPGSSLTGAATLVWSLRPASYSRMSITACATVKSGRWPKGPRERVGTQQGA
jgi:hypothetical protein